MHRAAALLSVVCVMAPAFAGESLSMREYEERCASYYAQAVWRFAGSCARHHSDRIRMAAGRGFLKGRHGPDATDARDCAALWRDASRSTFTKMCVAESHTWRSFKHSFMETFALSWPPTRLARGRFSRVGWTTRRKRFTPTFNGLCNSIAPN